MIGFSSHTTAAAKPMDRVLQEQIAYYRARAPEYD